MAKKQAGGIPTMDEMYVPEKKYDQMYVPEKEQGMYVPEKSKAKPKAEEFDLYKTVKKAANKDEGMKKGGKVSSASSRADGCCTKGKTKGRMV
jgi:hypothetical protein